MSLRTVLASSASFVCSLARRFVRSVRDFALGPKPQSEGGSVTEVTEVLRAPPPGGDEVVPLAVVEDLSTEVAPFADQDPVRPSVDTVIPEDVSAVGVAGNGEGVPQVLWPEEHEVGPVPQGDPFPVVPEVEVLLPPLPEVILGDTRDRESLGGVVQGLEVNPVGGPELVVEEVFIPRRSTRTRRPHKTLQITWVGQSYD